MRRSDLRTVTLALSFTLLSGCETTLPGGDLGAASPPDDAGAPVPPMLSGCLPFRNLAGVSAMTGAMRSIPGPNGGALVVVDDAVAGDADVPSLAIELLPGATVTDCLAASSPWSGVPTSAFDPPSLAPLSGAVAGDVALFYYVDPTYGSVGVAMRDPTSGRFLPGAALLWTVDRPTYGTAAVVSAGQVYALACTPARFLDADCTVARAPFGSADDESAYGYYVGGGRWSPRVDDAWPMTSGGTSMDVAWLPSQSRWLMAYVPPLGTTISVRSGLTPEGPWSAPIDVATCDLADPDMFCGGVHLHTAIATANGTVNLSYAAQSLSSDAGARRHSEPEKWWPRLVAVPLPPLP